MDGGTGGSGTPAGSPDASREVREDVEGDGIAGDCGSRRVEYGSRSPMCV